MEHQADMIIIGGGASGLALSVALKQMNAEKKVLILFLFVSHVVDEVSDIS